MYKIEEIHWETTPQELREIADQMEQGWAKKRVGQSTLIRRIPDKYMVLCIDVDQTRIQRGF